MRIGPETLDGFVVTVTKTSFVRLAALAGLLILPLFPLAINLGRGYGKRFGVLASRLFVLFVPLFWVWFGASVWALASLLRPRRHRGGWHPWTKASVIMAFLFTLLLNQWLNRPMRLEGARMRLSALGGGGFVSQLMQDAELAIAQKIEGHAGVFSGTNLPASFVALGAKGARVEAASDEFAAVRIVMSRRPFSDGLVLCLGERDPAGIGMLVTNGVYRY